MAKLKPIEFRAKSLTDETTEFKSEASVSNDGVFSVDIPDFLEELGRKLIRDYGSLFISRPRVYLRVSGKVLKECEDFIKHLLQQYIKCEKVEELVILYDYKNDLSYVKDSVTGELHPSGYGVKGFNETAHWVSGKNSTDSSTHFAQFFSVGLNAMVVTKTTYKRDSNITVKYSGGRGGGFGDGYVWAGKLNAFCRLGYPFDSKGVIKGGMMELPYTEDAAKFFYGLMMSMCHLADRVESFIGNKEQLAIAMENQSNFLLESK